MANVERISVSLPRKLLEEIAAVDPNRSGPLRDRGSGSARGEDHSDGRAPVLASRLTDCAMTEPCLTTRMLVASFMPKNTSFVVSDELSEFIQEQVSTGAYGSASEVVREALEKLAEEKRKEAALLSALDRGLASGRAKPGVFARLRKKHKIG